MRYIEYYELSISEYDFNIAFEKYKQYIEKKNLTLELSQDEFDNTEFEDFPEHILSHVVYHAELEGFNTDECMI